MRKLSLIIFVSFVYLSIAGCGGSKKKQEVAIKGSLNRIYKLVDDAGRESGTLVLNPMGGAELRDMDGNIIGFFTPADATSGPVVEKKASDENKKTE